MWQQREGGDQKKREGETEKRARWRNCRGSRMNSHFWHAERVFTFPGTVAQDGEGDWGRWEDVGRALCCFWTFTMNAPGCLVSHQPWKWLPYGKMGTLKVRKESENINVSRLVPITSKTQLVSVAAVNIATYSWVNNCHVIMWRGRLHTLPCAHKGLLHHIESINISFSLNLNVNS